ncbi:MAG: pilus assembly protein PilM [bacterium]|nr:pilus assembly protein PilM [bacterium]
MTFLTEAAGRVIAVDAGSRIVKIAEIRRRKEVVELSLLDAMPVPFASARGDVTPDQVRDTIHRLLLKHGIKTAALISILPREYVTVKRLELPSISRDELAQMLIFEAEKHVPFPLDRAQLDFDFRPLTPTPSTSSSSPPPANENPDQSAPPPSRSIVTLAASRQAVISKFLELFALRGFKQQAIDVSTFALYNAFLYLARRTPQLFHNGDVLLVEVGARRTELALVSADSHELLFSRSFDFGGDSITDAIAAHAKVSFEEAERRKCQEWHSTPLAHDQALLHATLQPLADHLTKSIHYISKHALTARIGAVWLSGGASLTPGLPDLIAATCGAAVHLFNPLAAFDTAPTDAPPALSAQVIGAALRTVKETRLTVDLLPVDVAKLQLFALRKKRLLQLAAAAAIVAACALTVFAARIAYSSYERRQLRAELERLLPEERRVDALEREYVALSNAVSDMERLIDTKTSWSRVLQTIAECMNTNVWIWQINLDNRQRANRLMLYVRALSRMDFIDFKDRLAASARFRNVTAGTVQQQNQFIEVPITCEVLPDYKYTERLNQLRALLATRTHRPSPTQELARITTTSSSAPARRSSAPLPSTLTNPPALSRPAPAP